MSDVSGDLDVGDEGLQRQALSSLVDGHLESSAVQRACGAWREDAMLRSTWHAYHLIGDVLRSDDLACAVSRDAAFLARLRVRMASEPVIMAPQPLEFAEVAAQQSDQPARLANGAANVEANGVARAPATSGATASVRFFRRAWAAPMAVAASFVAVAGLLVVTRMGGPAPGANVVASASPAPAAVGTMVDTSDAAVDMSSLGPDTKLVRDVRLDGYLAAHKQFGSTAAVSVPGVMLRNAATFVPER